MNSSEHAPDAVEPDLGKYHRMAINLMAHARMYLDTSSDNYEHTPPCKILVNFHTSINLLGGNQWYQTVHSGPPNGLGLWPNVVYHRSEPLTYGDHQVLRDTLNRVLMCSNKCVRIMHVILIVCIASPDQKRIARPHRSDRKSGCISEYIDISANWVLPDEQCDFWFETVDIADMCW